MSPVARRTCPAATICWYTDRGSSAGTRYATIFPRSVTGIRCPALAIAT